MKIHVRKLVVPGVLSIVLALALPLSYASDSQQAEESLYKRLGGYDAISAVVDDVVVQIATDEKLGRFWEHRGKDGITREKQLIVDFIVEQSGGPLYYTGREMRLSHEGMRIDEKDWNILINAVKNTLSRFSVPAREQEEVLKFFESTKKDIVEKSS